ncbi:hypothetical protein HYH03_017010 [Edaphochlamys debaryana]|uniref:Uncharacterized protein n=1 Tax=Edaphochlamys debaryana TaxID=47281 RepID=A0A836BR21_9CHLO|nr:hypothetical protein HYH03_017010 [Edaphochlamys debaryana]|eukprot:KAG2484198.1 hypothetical protein HYH03_017010 [Edaphochlamys debaryana]
MASLTKRLMGGWTSLHAAAASGDLQGVRTAVQKSPGDVDKATRERQTALHLAAAGGFEAVIGELLDRQARAGLQDEAGRTPLHVAASAGHPRAIAALLGPRNREGPAGRAALLAARDREGRDALGAAVAAGQAGAVEELLRQGADAARSVDAAGRGLMHAAVRCGHPHLLPLLAPACGLEQRDPGSGGTPLHAAAAAGPAGAACLGWLLGAGASVVTRDNAGRTPAEAALAAGQHGSAKAIREAVLSGAAGAGPGAAAAAGPGALAAGSRPQPAAPSPASHNLYGYPAPPAGAASGGSVTSSAAAAGPSGGYVSATPWAAPAQAPPPHAHDPSAPPAGGAAAEAGPAPAAPASGPKFEIPAQPPPPTYYPLPRRPAGRWRLLLSLRDRTSRVCAPRWGRGGKWPSCAGDT